MPAPDKIRICYVGDRGHQGRLSDGRLFIAYTTGAAPEGQAGMDRVLAVLHLFDADGNHLETESRLGGYCREQDTFLEDQQRAGRAAEAALDQLLAELTSLQPESCPVDIRPFGLLLDGVEYGFFYQPDDDENGMSEVVIHMPRDHWYFPWSWDTGEYDT